MSRTLMAFLACFVAAVLAVTMLPSDAIAQGPEPAPSSDASNGDDADADPATDDSVDDQPAATASDTDGDGDLDRPDGVSAAVTARVLGKPVEDLSKRTETMRTIANPDGSLTDEDFGTAVRVQDGDGTWEDVDYDLEKQPDGSYAPKVASQNVTIDGGDKKEAARLSFDDGSSLAVSWPAVLPEPTIDGGVATYKLSPDTDLIVAVTGNGVASRIRINSPPAADDPAFTLGLRADDLAVDQTASGGLKVTDGDGDQVGSTSTLVAWDAQVDDAGDPTNVVPVEADLTEVSSRGDVTKHDLELTAPEDFLNDPDTVYPVTIDPDISAVSHIRDTWVRSGTTSTQGSSYRLLLGRVGGDSNSSPAISYEQWAQGQLTGKKILKATMGLYQYDAGSCSARKVYVNPLTSGFTEASTVFTNRPSFTATTGDTTSFTTNRGRTGCTAGNGYVTADITNMVDAWAAGTYTNYGLQLSVPSASTGDTSYERRWCSSLPDTSATQTPCTASARVPYLKVTYNGPPNTATVPTTAQSRTYDGTLFVSSAKPTWSSTATDREASQVKYTIETRPTTSSSTVSASCATGLVASGATASCTPTASLANGSTYVVRAKATDAYGQVGPWSAWRSIKVDTTAPVVPTMTCTGVADKHWYEIDPPATTTCAVEGNGSEVEYQLNRKAQPSLPPGPTSTPVITIKPNAFTNIQVRSRTRAGAVSAWRQVAFGTGPASLLAPIEDDRSSSTFPVEAAAPSGADSAKVQWRFAPEAGDPGDWTDATSVKLAADDTTAWDGTVSGDDWSKTPKLVWNPKNETGISSTALVEVQVLFAYDGTDKASPLQRVQVVPHAFGGSFPTDEAGPGQVALFTGEFQMDTTDVDVPGYGGSLSLGRSHLSFANTATGPTGVFGPGWKADIAGPDEGQASLIPLDRTGTDGTFVLNSPEGESYVYRHTSGKSGALQTGTYKGVGETALDEDSLKLTLDGSTYLLTLTEWDGTKTIWSRTTTGAWKLEQVKGVEDNSTTSFVGDAEGYTSWIFAPAPSGVNCDISSQQPGCRALHLNYDGTGAAKRLTSVDLRIWDPKTGSDGNPGTAAGMSTISVAKYDYNAAGLLTAAWDPRLGDGASALKTEYVYDTVAGKTVVTGITEPGLKPWSFNHNSTTGKLTSITRAQDGAVGGAAATWTVKYGIGLAASGDGLPNLSPEATETWGQPAEDAPVAGAAVWGPERVPGSTPSADDNEYASLSYWTKSGRVTNTASFGAGAWQIDSQRYDEQGNTTWDLDAAGRNQALIEGSTLEETAGAADKYATLTVYNEAGTRVERAYTPTHDFVLDNGDEFTGRTVTKTTYDDEADASAMPGRPTTGDPDEVYGLAITETESPTDQSGPGSVESPASPDDTDTTSYQYNPLSAGDGDGWKLKTPTKVTTGKGADTSVTTTRFDDEGKVFETRTPQSNASTGANAEARTTHTDYYTAGTHPTRSACSTKPAWAGEVCWTGPTGSGTGVPAFTTAGYSTQLAATRVVESNDGADRTSITGYDAAGRQTTSSVTTSGVTSRAVASTTTSYSGTTGLVTSVSNGTQTMATTYDTWGRMLTQTDGNGNTATTTYDSAGRVKTANDGKGTYTYTYDGDDSKNKRERRGMVTKLDVGLASGTPSEFTAAYDDQGALAEQKYPGGMKATWTRDLTGTETTLDYTQGGINTLSFSNTIDSDGRVRSSNGPSSAQGYTYDSRDRLIKVADEFEGQCTVRKYEFTLDSNREKLRTYNPAGDGSCQTSTETSAVTSAFNAADQLTTGGYNYDKLGRTTLAPAADTLNPNETPGNLTVGYHANDMVATLSQTATEDGTSVTRGQDFTLDAADRISTIKDLVGTGQVAEAVNHYDNSDDSPAWTTNKTREQATDPWGPTTWTRNVATIGGDMGIIQSSDGTAKIQIANLHDDIVASVDIDGTGLDSYAESTEYGASRPTSTDATPDRYGWLGAKQRQSVGITGGLTLMGARLYNPVSGRFLSRDPVPGGNDNTYTYPADPINKYDLNGLQKTSGEGGGARGGGITISRSPVPLPRGSSYGIGQRGRVYTNANGLRRISAGRVRNPTDILRNGRYGGRIHGKRDVQYFVRGDARELFSAVRRSGSRRLGRGVYRNPNGTVVRLYNSSSGGLAMKITTTKGNNYVVRFQR